MKTASQCPPDTDANSVDVLKICLYKVVEDPEDFCGDEVCNGDETCSTCAQDCGECPEPPKPRKKSSSSTIRYLDGFCDPYWECSGWGECNNDFMKRTCTDSNRCETEYNKPFEKTGCGIISKALVEGEEGNNFWLILGLLITFILLLVLIVLVNKGK